jgi:alpha-D-ribose 1-methylphosphonate 5-triphosphate diphosphatase
MKPSVFMIENCTAMLPEGLTEEVSLWIEDGRIRSVGEEAPLWAPRINGEGMLLSPGFIDLHSDAIEKEIRPRPGGSFPLDIALSELDKKLAACGITRMYHCLCFGESETNDLRTSRMGTEIANKLKEMAPHFLVNNRVHVRFEVSDLDSVEDLHRLLDKGGADLLSFMDHTPGQGQFTDLEHFKTYYSQAEHLTQEQAITLAENRMQQRDLIGNDHLFRLAAHAKASEVILASHDDDTPEKVDWVHALGVNISEFPVSLAAAKRASDLGMETLMGAPNVLRGGSLTGNLSGIEAIRAGACSLLGSDYAPMTMMHAAFKLVEMQVLDLPEALAMISTRPARAMGLEHEVGSIKAGCLADLVLIDHVPGRVPRLVKTFVSGREVYAAPRHTIQPTLSHANVVRETSLVD